MSQIIKNLASGPVPPAVPTSFVTNVNSPSVPIANVENIFGGSISTNNINGIQTDGSSGSNTLTIQLTNRITGSATTTDGTTVVNLYSLPLGATPGTYLFFTRVVAYNITDAIGAVYTSYRGVRTTGAAAVLINASESLVGEEGSFTESEVVNGISGNNSVITVQGIAGKTIDWYVLTEITFVS